MVRMEEVSAAVSLGGFVPREDISGKTVITNVLQFRAGHCGKACTQIAPVSLKFSVKLRVVTQALNPTLGRQRKAEPYEFEVSLVFITSCSPVRARW